MMGRRYYEPSCTDSVPIITKRSIKKDTPLMNYPGFKRFKKKLNTLLFLFYEIFQTKVHGEYDNIYDHSRHFLNLY